MKLTVSKAGDKYYILQQKKLTRNPRDPVIYWEVATAERYDSEAHAVAAMRKLEKKILPCDEA
jgi:hypothetical protein